MIRATILRDGSSYRGYVVEGHAEYAEPGEDVICAAVSVLAVNTANSIESLTGDEVVSEEREGYIHCAFPKGTGAEGTLLVESMLLGFRQIAELSSDDGDGNFLTVHFEEV